MFIRGQQWLSQSFIFVSWWGWSLLVWDCLACVRQNAVWVTWRCSFEVTKKKNFWNWLIGGKIIIIYQLQVYWSDHHKYHYQVGPGLSLCLCLCCSVLCCSRLSHGAVWWIINTSPSRTANCDITSSFYCLLPIGFRDGWKHSVERVDWKCLTIWCMLLLQLQMAKMHRC